MTEITVPSGAKVSINQASFEDAFSLKNAIQQEIKNSKINLNISEMSSSSDINIGEFVNIAMGVDSNPEVNKALMKCLLQCLYNGEKITMGTFESKERRQDYMPIMIECLKENVTDFFKPLVLKLFALLATAKSTDTQTST